MTTMTTEKIVVDAMSTEHAKRVASTLAQFPLEAIRNVKMITKPREAKTCQTDDYPVKKARKWQTQYSVYSYGKRIPIGKNKFLYSNLELVAEGFKLKTEAVKAARELAIKHQLPMTVKIVKVLVDEDNTVSDVTPKTALGKYEVEYVV